MDIFAMVCAGLAILALFWMGWIDLKLWILPDELVLLLALVALPFHFAIDWLYGGWLFFVCGAVVGAGALWSIRAIANHMYGFETLGLGDVKLMGAVGLWLGPEAVLMSLSLGAFCGVLHAMMIAFRTNTRLQGMMLPAGPGFIAGSLIIGIYTYGELLL